MKKIQFDFTDTTVLVTGGAGGIAKAIALGFGAAGANVVIGDLKEELGMAAVEEIIQLGGNAKFVSLDVTNQDAVDAFVQTAVDTYGSVDVLVNGAGVLNRTLGNPFTALTDADFDLTYSVNLKGMVHTCRSVYDRFCQQGFGSIINVCSVVGHSTNLLTVPYATSKAATLNLTTNLAKEMGPYGVTVNALCPGYVYTPLYEQAAPAMGERNPALLGMSGQEIVDYFSKLNCATQREQTVEDLAIGAMYLASEGGQNITGLILDIAGGYKL